MFTNARDIIINGKEVNIQDKPRSVSAGAGSKVSNKSGKDNGSSEVEDEIYINYFRISFKETFSIAKFNYLSYISNCTLHCNRT